MSTMLSKRTVNQTRYAHLVTDTLDATRERLIAGLSEPLGSKAEGEQVVRALSAVAKAVHDHLQAYREQVERVGAESEEERQAREEVSRHQEALEGTLSSVRLNLEGALGFEALAAYGFSSPTPAVREQLSSYAHIVLERFAAAPKQVTNPLGSSFDTSLMAEAIRKRVKTFDQLHETLRREQKETEHSRSERDQADESFQLLLINAARMLEGALRMAGLDYEADRIRPSFRRVRGHETLDGPDSPQPAS